MEKKKHYQNFCIMQDPVCLVKTGVDDFFLVYISGVLMSSVILDALYRVSAGRRGRVHTKVLMMEGRGG